MYQKMLILLLGLAFIGCKQEPTEISDAFKDSLPSSNGGPMDVIVVAKDHIWRSQAGEIFRAHYTAAQAGLPQAEAIFNVRQISPKDFNPLLQRSRNIIFLSEDSSQTGLAKNRWAKPQMVVSITGKDIPTLAKNINSTHKDFIESLRAHEIQMAQQRMVKGLQKNPKLLTKKGISLKIPKAFEIEVETENTIVLWNKTIKTDQALILYFEPMNEALTSLGEDIIPLRDSLTQLYILSEQENAYMTTEDLVSPSIKNVVLANEFAFETRGLWRTVNDFKGGPFINYTVYDQSHNQVIFMDGFVFSPETAKRNFLLEIEAIFKSLEIKD